MICLGIEGTAHTLGIGIINRDKILVNEKDSFTTEQGGMVPNEVAQHHQEVQYQVLEKALKKAKLKKEDIDVIAFSQGPGMAPCLIETMKFAKALAEEWNVPLMGVNHIAAHLEIGRAITKTEDPIFVFVSGANTQIIAHEGGKYRIFGETLSIAIGNAFDKFARLVGLGFPGGPKIEELAKKGKYIELPYKVKGMDVDFSGIVTKAEQLYKKGAKVEDLCYSLQETCFAMLTEVTERALAHCDKKEVILIGGVAANRRFCSMLDTMCRQRNAKFYPLDIEYCGDNGVMIAILGLLEYKFKVIPKLDQIDINPMWRVDDLAVPWINYEIHERLHKDDPKLEYCDC